MFCDIDATEYLDDLWSRHGPHLHVNISKFEDVRMFVMHIYALHIYYASLQYILEGVALCFSNCIVLMTQVMLQTVEINNKIVL